MRIISWNVSCLPKLINPYMNPFNNIKNILFLLKKEDVDIICLQEVFDNSIIDILIKELCNYYYFKLDNYFFWKDGLIIFSKFKIQNTKFKKFKNCHGFENIISKGILSVLVYDTVSKKNIWIHNTHLQASNNLFSKKKSVNIRKKQLLEINDYFNTISTTDHILCGDFNIFFKDLKNYKFFFDNYNFNKNELITFPAYNQQFDYILYSFNCKINYEIIKNNFSDHYLLIANFIN